jgi:dTDP-4-amino-4,6-dideoxygalactose transaminase
MNCELEQHLIDSLFQGVGHCVTVCNATIGLMLAIRLVIDRKSGAGRARKYALMPAFTFAATAHAAIWNNLIPLFCDIEPDTWQASPSSLRDLIVQFSDEIAVIVPYATFGQSLDLSAYQALSSDYELPVVVDAAASLGCVDACGRQFGSGSPDPVIYSMHVTKTFSTSEAGMVYCNDEQTVEQLRAMGNFGFGIPRCATLPGLNAKLSEIGALLALEKLKAFGGVIKHRQQLEDVYRQHLPELTFQATAGGRNAYQFMPALVPANSDRQRDYVIAKLAEAGVMAGKYFSPHLAEQPYFRERCKLVDLSVTEEVGSRIISLPMYDSMTLADVQAISEAARAALTS